MHWFFVSIVLAVAECGIDSVKTNATINTFIDSRKLQLSQKKCQKIHIGKCKVFCPELKANDERMEKVNSDKYLGDVVSSCGTSQPTIKSRAAKGFGISNEILTIIDEVPLGGHRASTGVKLREAMLVNGILFNSEVWYGIKEDDIIKLEKVDEYLLRGILKSHSKIPRAALYLETGCIPMRY